MKMGHEDLLLNMWKSSGGHRKMSCFLLKRRTLKDIPSVGTCSVFSGSNLKLGWKDGYMNQCREKRRDRWRVLERKCRKKEGNGEGKEKRGE